ncbi:hypothetical protein DQ04_02911030, partial [Trypanosoma grayi]|uniref:hypothetical protein n=1 Tax=Trypanosoma grayi TaxID=71804 RepID=UPI0004F40EF7
MEQSGCGCCPNTTPLVEAASAAATTTGEGHFPRAHRIAAVDSGAHPSAPVGVLPLYAVAKRFRGSNERRHPHHLQGNTPRSDQSLRGAVLLREGWVRDIAKDTRALLQKMPSCARPISVPHSQNSLPLKLVNATVNSLLEGRTGHICCAHGSVTKECQPVEAVTTPHERQPPYRLRWKKLALRKPVNLSLSPEAFASPGRDDNEDSLTERTKVKSGLQDYIHDFLDNKTIEDALIARVGVKDIPAPTEEAKDAPAP